MIANKQKRGNQTFYDLMQIYSLPTREVFLPKIIQPQSYLFSRANRT